MAKSKARPISERGLSGSSDLDRQVAPKRASGFSRILGPSRRHATGRSVRPCGFRALMRRKPGMACPYAHRTAWCSGSERSSRCSHLSAALAYRPSRSSKSFGRHFPNPLASVHCRRTKKFIQTRGPRRPRSWPRSGSRQPSFRTPGRTQ